MTHGTLPPAAESPPGANDARSERLREWLAEGRLRLIDRELRDITAADWDTLAPAEQDAAIREFNRVVGGRTRAAVIFVRPSV